MLPLPSPPASANERALAGWSRERITGATGSTLTLNDTPAEGLELVTKNGAVLDPASGYTIAGRTITLGVAAVSGDVFLIFYYARGGA